MDNFTHSLTGWALGQTGLKRKSRKGLAALILGANAPDIDVFFFWVPWAPLATHRGVTHSLVAGLLVLPLGLAALLWLLDRCQASRGARFKSGLEMDFRWLVALSFLGCLTHPLLDWQTSYAVQLFSPFTDLWFHNDSLFIIDVWIWTGLAFAIWLSRRRERRDAGDWRRPAIAACAALVAYISANGALTAWAQAEARRSEPYANPDVMVSSPLPALFWRRNLTWREDGRIFAGEFDAFRNRIGLTNHTAGVPDGMDDPLALEVLQSHPGLARFGRWSILPMAFVTRERCRTLIRYQDARFGMRPESGRLGEAVSVPTGAPGCGAPALES